MKQVVALVAKRLLVLLCGLVVALFIVFGFFPFFDDRLPLLIAVLATYCFIAYLALPALVRVWQLVHKPTRVPTRSHARDGWALDPINLVVLAQSEREFIWAMGKAGWVLADPLTLKTALKMAASVIFNLSYPAAPFSNTYVFGKKHDLGFQIQAKSNAGHRHHVRFWRLGTTILDGDHEHHGFWHGLLKKFLTTKKGVWVGAISLESGLNVTRRTLQITHRQDGNTDLARDFLVSTLKDAKTLKDAIGIKAGEPLHTRYQGFREVIISDGYVTLCELKRQYTAPVKPLGKSAR